MLADEDIRYMHRLSSNVTLYSASLFLICLFISHYMC